VSLESAALIFAALFVGSITKGVTGFGLPMVAVPLLAGFIGVERAVVVMVIPTFASNAWLMWEHRAQAVGSWGHLALFLAVSMAATVAGTQLLVLLAPRTLVLILAAWLGLYLLAQLFRPGMGVPPRCRTLVSVPVAAAAGVMQGAMGVPGPIVASWFHALRLEPAAYVFSVCAVFFATSFVQIFSLAGFGLFSDARLAEGLLALVPSLAGLPIGIRLARRIDKRAFNAFLMALLVAMEAHLIWQGLGG
jgi:uncharacterized membrane protein YfcA